MFFFKGPVITSKSWFNRALVIRHFNENLVIKSTTNTNADSDDVVCLKRAIESIGQTNSFYLGLGGTSFRFFVFLISRHSGRWIVKAHESLLERPQQEIIGMLNQLGVKAEFIKSELHVESGGWHCKNKIVCSSEVSSQFISGLLLSCWNLASDIEIEIKKPVNSYGYLRLTIELLRQAGMPLETDENEKFLVCRIPKNQKALVENLITELDISSAFSLVAAAVINGRAEITNWKSQSLQPDFIFLEIFKKMNILYKVEDQSFLITKQENWGALDYNLNSAPDLFPVLAVLCAFANGVSTLYGARQLVHKESNRILKTQQLLKLAGVQTEVLEDGLRIYGKSSTVDFQTKLLFNPDQDHRMAMAAALLKLKGYNIQIEHPEVVKKSYPDFWKDIGFQT